MSEKIMFCSKRKTWSSFGFCIELVFLSALLHSMQKIVPCRSSFPCAVILPSNFCNRPTSIMSLAAFGTIWKAIGKSATRSGALVLSNLLSWYLKLAPALPRLQSAQRALYAWEYLWSVVHTSLFFVLVLWANRRAETNCFAIKIKAYRQMTR